jgi:hypothetical protein
MLKRLLIAAPFAAIAVAALFWVMREFVFPAGRMQADYRITFCHNCTPAPGAVIPDSGPDRVIDDGAILMDPPPSPELVPMEPPERQKMPRDRFPPPERTPPDSLEFSREIPKICKDGSKYAGTTCCNLLFPRHAKHGDYVVVEYDFDTEGWPRDIKVVESSNPKINKAALRNIRQMLRRDWLYRNCFKGKPEKTEGLRARITFELEKPPEGKGGQ